ncbi:uncharacterized protein E0L32_004141 [Thyridium curvatum]|uniref:Uncharacterized protein n=1 Tax=Thyridium curvatum TaxID=1093900 RepID=A0A507BAB3_9PEZI|nr:uncharacterized protein E0L32_004141 [Thyridium curvatum]TPX16146.1 hypothetical protein E0L32_004141 [Thyridium curvatum]
MLQLEDITYSRTATIAAVSDYYRFLATMYLENSQVIYPPEGGWPSIVNADREVLQSLGKSDEVLALLAHLPYIRCPRNWNDDAEAAPGCVFADWQQLIKRLGEPSSGFTGESVRIMTEGAEFTELAPAHVVSLTAGDRENPVLILDTKLGIIHWEDGCPPELEDSGWFGERVDYEPDDDVPDEEAQWRYSATAWAIPDFFDALKAQFVELQWIPISQHCVRGVSGCGSDEVGMVAMLQDIYREHGWPDLGAYRKSKCLAAVRKAMSENYPTSACLRG